MSEKEPVSLDALNGLLKERQRYEEWIAALEAKRATTSESVYERVHGDYSNNRGVNSSTQSQHGGFEITFC